MPSDRPALRRKAGREPEPESASTEQTQGEDDAAFSASTSETEYTALPTEQDVSSTSSSEKDLFGPGFRWRSVVDYIGRIIEADNFEVTLECVINEAEGYVEERVFERRAIEEVVPIEFDQYVLITVKEAKGIKLFEYKNGEPERARKKHFFTAEPLDLDPDKFSGTLDW